MSRTYWSLPTTLNQALFAIIVFSIWMMVGMFVMKYLVRRAPIFTHAGILFWATIRVQIIVLTLGFLGTLFNISIRPFSGLLSVLALCAIGWLVTQHLSRYYRVPTKFPAVGAIVIIAMVIITLLIIIAIIVVTGA
jgi:hypothetical protein